MSHGEVKTVFESIFGLNAAEFALFAAQYSELHRFYHTLDHIEDCLCKLTEVKDLTTDLQSIQIALLFHDYFYDPKSKDNEAKSAEYAFNLLESLEFMNSKKIKDLILLTKHPSTPTTNDERFLLDIDLSILGEKKETYEVYEENIRKEYKHVPKFLYSTGRKKLLKNFLEQERIFHTDFFYEKFEKQAHENLKWAIKSL